MKHVRLFTFVLSAVCLVAVVPLASPGTEQINTRTDYPFDWYLTPADYPCLVETIHASGTFVERVHVVFNPSGGYSYQVQQTVQDVTAVGLTTGRTYQYNGPLSFEENGKTDEPWVTWYPVEWTFHNLNNFQGPGKLPNIYMRTLSHVTLDRTTGEVKVEVFRDVVTCK